MRQTSANFRPILRLFVLADVVASWLTPTYGSDARRRNRSLRHLLVSRRIPALLCDPRQWRWLPQRSARPAARHIPVGDAADDVVDASTLFQLRGPAAEATQLGTYGRQLSLECFQTLTQLFVFAVLQFNLAPTNTQAQLKVKSFPLGV